MSYLTLDHVKSWLESTKYPISAVDRVFETNAKTSVFGKVGVRYDTTSWTNTDSTPDLILSVMGMLVAAYEMRKTASEEDGQTKHAEWLEARVMHLCEAIIDGSLVLEGVEVNPASPLGGSIGFWPTDESTTLSETDPYHEDATPRAFSMNMRF